MENPNAIRWIVRQADDYKTSVERYTENNQRFISIETIHDGFFKRRSGLRYTGDKINIFDFIDVGDLTFRFLEKMFISVGFSGRPFFYYQHPKEEFEYGMIRLETPADFASFQCTVWPRLWRATQIIYAEADIPTIPISYPMSLLDVSRAKIVRILSPCISKNPHIEAEAAQTIPRKKYGIRFPLKMIEAVKDEVVVAVWGKRKDMWGLGS